MVVDEGVKRAIAETDLARCLVRLIAALSQRLEQFLTQSLLAWSPSRSFPRCAAGRLAHRLSGHADGVERELRVQLLDGLCEQLCGDPVTAVGQQHGNITRSLSIQLGRSPGAWTRTSRQAAIFCDHQAVGNEPIKMERSEGARDFDRLRGLITADCTISVNDPPVERASDRFGEQSYRLEIGRRVWHREAF